MHAHTTKNDTIFHYSSDGSGDVFIQVPSSTDKDRFNKICVPFGDLLDFVANFVRYQKVGELEQADAKDILGIK